jgi:hypothetical protein
LWGPHPAQVSKRNATVARGTFSGAVTTSATERRKLNILLSGGPRC